MSKGFGRCWYAKHKGGCVRPALLRPQKKCVQRSHAQKPYQRTHPPSRHCARQSNDIPNNADPPPNPKTLIPKHIPNETLESLQGQPDTPPSKTSQKTSPKQPSSYPRKHIDRRPERHPRRQRGHTQRLFPIRTQQHSQRHDQQHPLKAAPNAPLTFPKDIRAISRKEVPERKGGAGFKTSLSVRLALVSLCYLAAMLMQNAAPPAKPPTRQDIPRLYTYATAPCLAFLTFGTSRFKIAASAVYEAVKDLKAYGWIVCLRNAYTKLTEILTLFELGRAAHGLELLPLHAVMPVVPPSLRQPKKCLQGVSPSPQQRVSSFTLS